jgi:orotidine-5'-phosphate decarboxylase
MSAERAGGGAQRRIIVALDYPEPGQALRMAERLNPAACRLKVGKELFTRGGPALVEQLMTRNFSVFLDLKFHDIPNTVEGAMRAAARLNVDMVNLHICGGEAMVKAAVAGAKEGAALAGHKAPLLLGVTVLTSLGPKDLAVAGIPADLYAAGLDESAQLTALALRRAEQARAWGLDGVVCSGHEAAGIKRVCGTDFICLTPGIRPRSGEVNDQSRVMTPAEAVAVGADFLVVGRPITAAPDPLQAMQTVLHEMG